MFNFAKKQSLSSREKIMREIASIEKKYSILFPELLVEFYNFCNGEIIGLACYASQNSIFYVDHFYPVFSDDDLTLQTILQYDREDGFIRKSFVPLAEDEGGNRYYWENETHIVYFLPCDDIDNPELVCDSLSDFLSSLLLEDTIQE